MMSIFFLLFAIIGIVFFVWWKSPKQKGKRGERKVHKILSHLPSDYYVMDDVLLKIGNSTTQIDHIVISRYGLFAIETKNYKGEIYGDDCRHQWTQIIVTEVRYRRNWYKVYTYVTKNHFYNPVKQSIGHIYGIKKNLPGWPRLKIIPIVVFTGEANISNVRSSNHVIYDFDLLATIQNYKTVCLSDLDVQNIINCISKRNVRDTVDDKSHIRNVEASKDYLDRKKNSGICPKCGGVLVKRNGKFGVFYGCTNYPQCDFTTR
ncbi:MAG: NERD domain-containing protein [Paludibacteraceae bacterium]|nr:NERD domain-containing protein [Paludibacteraceae bacterium]